MTLTDPREALAEQSNFIGYLMGLASLAGVVHVLAADGDARADNPRDADDFVHVLLGRREPWSGDRAAGRIRSGATHPSATPPAPPARRTRGGCDERGARQ